MQEYFEIGQIVNTFGIKGMVKVVPYTDDITRFDNLKNVIVVTRKERKTFEIEEVKYGETELTGEYLDTYNMIMAQAQKVIKHFIGQN